MGASGGPIFSRWLCVDWRRRSCLCFCPFVRLRAAPARQDGITYGHRFRCRALSRGQEGLSRLDWSGVSFGIKVYRSIEVVKREKFADPLPLNPVSPSPSVSFYKKQKHSVRSKRLLGLKTVDVYSLGFYVDPATLSSRHGGGKESSSDALLTKIAADAAVAKTLRVVVTTGMLNASRFVKGVRESLAPALAKVGASGSMVREFKSWEKREKREKREEREERERRTRRRRRTKLLTRQYPPRPKHPKTKTKTKQQEAFEALFDGLSLGKGTELVFSNVPSSGALRVRVAGKEVGIVNDKRFAPALFGLYFGPESVSPSGRDDIKAGIERGLSGGGREE